MSEASEQLKCLSWTCGSKRYCGSAYHGNCVSKRYCCSAYHGTCGSKRYRYSAYHLSWNLWLKAILLYVVLIMESLFKNDIAFVLTLSCKLKGISLQCLSWEQGFKVILLQCLSWEQGFNSMSLQCLSWEQGLKAMSLSCSTYHGNKASVPPQILSEIGNFNGFIKLGKF